MPRTSAAVLLALTLGTGAFVAAAAAQTPQPFPRPGSAPPPPRPAAPPPAPAAPDPAQPAPAAAQPPADEPSPEAIGIPVYPGAQFLGAYNAGMAQRMYLFGTTAPFTQIVGYYQTLLDSRGDLVYREPATHMFSGGALGRYREDSMALPPSVTVKDWTSGGSQGYPNLRGGDPARFPTVIMIVPAPPGAQR